jgi:hypothetical protein
MSYAKRFDDRQSADAGPTNSTVVSICDKVSGRSWLLDYLISTRKECGGHRQTKSLRSLEINHQIVAKTWSNCSGSLAACGWSNRDRDVFAAQCPSLVTRDQVLDRRSGAGTAHAPEELRRELV